jgi:hypothetical protein
MNGLHKALKKILGQGDEQHFEEIYQRLPAKVKDDLEREQIGQTLQVYLLQAGDTMQAVSNTHRKVVSRQSLFRDCSFRIQLTPSELEDKRLIIGHRLQPFIHPEIPVEELRFYDENDLPLPLERVPLTVNQSNSIYFNLLPPYGIAQYLEGDGNSQTLLMAMIDLSAWISAQKYEAEDQIRVSVKNYEKLEFYIEKLSSREIARLVFADRHYESNLTEAIYQVFEIIGRSILPVDMHLLWAYAQLDPELITNGGTPFGPFISRHESLTFYQEGPFAFLQNKHFMEELMENAIQDAQHSSPEEKGNATKLDGIFQELGNSFSELLLRACMIEQLLEWDEINEEALMIKVFDTPDPSFYNPRQASNFKTAYNKLLRSVRKKWAEQRLALPHLQLLRKSIQFKMEIVVLLRALNQIRDPQQLNMQALFQLQPIDHSLDQILENILSKQPMSYQEAQSLVKQLDSGREKFQYFRDELLEE